MATKRQKQLPDSLRLSRETTSPSLSRSETPLTDDRSNRSSTQPRNNGNTASKSQSEDRTTTEAGAEDKEEVGDDS